MGLFSAIKDTCTSPNAMAWWRYFGMVNVSLTGAVFMCLFLNTTYEAQVYTDNSHHVLPVSVMFVPIPIAFLFWARLMDRQRTFGLRFSPVFFGISIGAFIGTLLLADMVVRQVCLATAIVSGLFVWLPLKDCLSRMRRQPGAALVMLIAASATFNYYMTMTNLWIEMRGWTTWVVYNTLHFFGANAYAVVHPRVNTTIFIRSPSFTVWVNNGCNGLEGIFLFNFLLSLMFLLDWHLFSRARIVLTYLFGFAYMFMVNALRITLYYTVGYWAYKLDVPDWVKAMRGFPVIMFHTYVGWVLYLIAFGIFALLLYRSLGRKKRKQALS